MKLFQIFLITCLSLVANVDLLKVHVLYESLCSDSVMFITRELYPNFKELDKYIELTLVPYGKAQVSKSHIIPFILSSSRAIISKTGNCVLMKISHYTSLGMPDPLIIFPIL